jgi:hypothetical protein
MEHIFFEVRLCIKISILKEKHDFDILIILCLMTSLQIYIFLGTLKRTENHQNPLIKYITNRFIFVHVYPSISTLENMFLFLPMLAVCKSAVTLIFRSHLVCKSAVNWLPEGPAAGTRGTGARGASGGSPRMRTSSKHSGRLMAIW